MQTITPICPSQYSHTEISNVWVFFSYCKDIIFSSECITGEKSSCQCVLPMLFGRSVKIVFNVVKAGNIKTIYQVLSHFSGLRSGTNNLKILGRFSGLWMRSWVLSKWQPEILQYNRMGAWISPAVGKQKLMRRNLSWKESYCRWQQQQKSWHRAITQSGVPDFHHAEARQKKVSSWSFMCCISFRDLTGH